MVERIDNRVQWVGCSKWKKKKLDKDSFQKRIIYIDLSFQKWDCYILLKILCCISVETHNRFDFLELSVAHKNGRIMLSPWYHLDNIYGFQRIYSLPISFFMRHYCLQFVVVHLWHIYFKLLHLWLFQVAKNQWAHIHEKKMDFSCIKYVVAATVTVAVAVSLIRCVCVYNVNNKSDCNQLIERSFQVFRRM